MPMVIRLIRMVTYHGEFPSINSHDPSMKGSCDKLNTLYL